MSAPYLAVFIIAGIIVIWNIITFAMYGIDKRKAQKKKWRISESTLILCAFLMGAAGALAGMSVFRHKTNHLKFKLLVPIALAMNIAVAFFLLHHFEILNLFR